MLRGGGVEDRMEAFAGDIHLRPTAVRIFGRRLLNETRASAETTWS